MPPVDGQSLSSSFRAVSTIPDTVPISWSRIFPPDGAVVIQNRVPPFRPDRGPPHRRYPDPSHQNNLIKKFAKKYSRLKIPKIIEMPGLYEIRQESHDPRFLFQKQISAGTQQHANPFFGRFPDFFFFYQRRFRYQLQPQAVYNTG